MNINLKNRALLPTLKRFRDRLKWARENAGLSQKALAESSGYTQKQISNLEAGVTERPRKINSLAKCLNVSPAWLTFGLEELDTLEERSIGLALVFETLPEEDKQYLEELTKRLKKGKNI